ncbi:MAG: hypothetical protein JSS72_11765 [Armatimonadetes bacterium]|nr:hypothetical protein [Armatimonadota bacterium]
MITCHLTKLETALDQIRKSFPKVKPADAALLASALSVTGRHALALQDGEQYQWPEDVDKLSRALVPQVELVQDAVEPVKKKSATEEEPATLSVGLTPNLSAGERLLEGRNDLKTKLADILQDGVEFQYANTDIGWQWSLDHVNWATVTGDELKRRVRVKCTFTEGAVGVETGTTTKKKRGAKEVAVVEEVVAEPDTAEIVAEIEEAHATAE